MKRRGVHDIRSLSVCWYRMIFFVSFTFRVPPPVHNESHTVFSPISDNIPKPIHRFILYFFFFFGPIPSRYFCFFFFHIGQMWLYMNYNMTHGRIVRYCCWKTDYGENVFESELVEVKPRSYHCVIFQSTLVVYFTFNIDLRSCPNCKTLFCQY